MKRFTFSVLALLVAQVLFAQYNLTFCEDVNNEGKPQMASNSFMVDNDGGVLKFLISSDDKLNTEKVEYRIFYINDTGKEEEITKLPQKVEPSWNFAWKEVVFYDPGIYKIKVFNSKGSYLTSANLNVKPK